MKNNRIQFWRIVMTYVIAFYHLNKQYGIYTSGYIAVEFFFMVSGYLLADKFYGMQENGGREQMSAWRYFSGKYRKYWPHSAFAFFTAFAAVGIYRGYSANDCAIGIVTHLPELFLINMLGFQTGGGVSYNDITWYLSVLLILSFIIWLLMKINARAYTRIIVPISITLIYPFLYMKYGMLCVHEEFVSPFLAAGIVRGFADMNIGIVSYFVVKQLREKHIRHISLLSTICLLIGGLVLPQLFYQSKYDFLMLLMIFAGTSLAFATDDNRIFDKPLVEKWAGITIVIYLNHEVLKVLFRMVWDEITPLVYVIWFVVITVYSAVVYRIVGWSVSSMNRFLARKFHK